MAGERKITPTHEAPYLGLRVLDFGQGIASPYCAMLLGAYGADVTGEFSAFIHTVVLNDTRIGAHTDATTATPRNSAVIASPMNRLRRPCRIRR